MAAAKVPTLGWKPFKNLGFTAGQQLAVISATPSACGAGCPTRLFFFGNGQYLGSDTPTGSGTVETSLSGISSVTATYLLYSSTDSDCCPVGRSATGFVLRTSSAEC